MDPFILFGTPLAPEKEIAMDPSVLFGIPIAVVAGVYFLILIIRNFMYICRPHEILIFSGGSSKTVEGKTQGIRVIAGGRAFRTPILEQVAKMDRTLISVPMSIEGAYSEGGIPLSVRAIANVKISSDPRIVHNAIERFLGRDRKEMARVAKETLEGHLRGVLSSMTPEEINEDRLKFAEKLAEEAEDDLSKLGLHLDTLKIQHVSDEVNYLDSIGRERIAIIIKEAEVAESDAIRAAEEAEAAALGRGGVAKTQAQANIQRKQNELRQLRAELDAKAKSEEERALAGAQAARAVAERELQEIRAELEQLRLEADVVIPAEIQRQTRELEAAGLAAPIAENGRAMAGALATMAEAWKECDGQAMNIFVLQRIDKIFARVAQATADLKVGEVSLLDSAGGKALPSYVSAYPAILGAVLREICGTLGVDLGGALTASASPKNGSVPAPAPQA
jgi:flotillin